MQHLVTLRDKEAKSLKDTKDEEIEIVYLTIHSDAISQTVLRNWAYHLHKPAQTTKVPKNTTVAQVRKTNKSSQMYECDM